MAHQNMDHQLTSIHDNSFSKTNHETEKIQKLINSSESLSSVPVDQNGLTITFRQVMSNQVQ